VAHLTSTETDRSSNAAQLEAKQESGYEVDRILTMTVTSVQGDWADFHHRALERVMAVPGVQRAAFVWGTPLTGNDWPSTLEIEDHPVTSPRDRVSQSLRSVTPGYFELMGVPIVDGRDFRDNDKQKEPRVAIVNQAFADKYFPGSRPIGKHLWLGPRDQPANEIVGGVGNARTADLTRAPLPEVYLSLWQSSAFSKDLVVRTAADPRAVIAAVPGELRGVNPTVSIEKVRTLAEVRTDRQWACPVCESALRVAEKTHSQLVTPTETAPHVLICPAAAVSDSRLRARQWPSNISGSKPGKSHR